MPALLALPVLLLDLLVGSGTERTGDVTMFDFREDSTSDWIIVNDGVMGGLSQSEFTGSGEGYATFQGTMSLENNGGFASVRALVPSVLPSATTTVTLRVRGDGRTYQVRFRTDRRFDGIAYMAEFSTVVGEWLTIELPISEFRPTFRGWTPPDAPPLVPGEIRQVGLMVADKKAGPFRLDVQSITASD
jgi:monofunctional biosynthetic peptidoglycan transglycosylase